LPNLAAAPTDAAPDLVQAQQQLFHRAAEQVAPSVVRIETVGGAQESPLEAGETLAKEEKPEENPFRDDPGSSFRLADGPTTGLVWSADGYILTSSFNFVRDPALITVIVPAATDESRSGRRPSRPSNAEDGPQPTRRSAATGGAAGTAETAPADGAEPAERRYVATLVARDRVRKLALLKIDATGLPVPAWADSADIRVGQWVVALGRAFGGREPTVTVGIVSALGRMMGNAVQTDAKLSPANYGGPLVDLRGRVVGLCVPMAQRPGELAGVEMYDSGVGFAVPKSRLDELVPALREGTSFYRGWLGMQIDPHDPEHARIGALADPSPLRSAGAESGDVLTRLNGRPILHFGHVVQALYMLPAGEMVDVRLLRGDREIEFRVPLARAEELGSLPEIRPPFDPADPFPEPEGEGPPPEP